MTLPFSPATAFCAVIAFFMCLSFPADAQHGKQPGLRESVENRIDGKKKASSQRQMMSSGFPSGLSDLSFINGETNIALLAGLQKNLSGVAKLPQIQLEFSDRLPRILGQKWLLDYFSVKAQAALSGASPLKLTPMGIGYALNAATDLIGFQAFKNPTLADMLNFSSIQGALSLNLLRTPPSTRHKAFVVANWTLAGSYTPAEVSGSADGITDLLEEINNRINGLSQGVITPLKSDSIRKLTDIANSLKQIPQALQLRNLKLESIPQLLNTASDVVNLPAQKGDPLFLFYTGPSIAAGSVIPNTQLFHFAVYGQFLLPLSRPETHRKVYILETSSLLDSIGNYLPALKDLDIPVESRQEVEKTRAYYRQLLVYGAQLSCEFYAVSFYLSYQGIRQMNNKKQDRNFITNGSNTSSAWGIGMNINLTKIFMKPECGNEVTAPH